MYVLQLFILIGFIALNSSENQSTHKDQSFPMNKTLKTCELPNTVKLQQYIGVTLEFIGIAGNALVVIVTLRYFKKSTYCQRLIGCLAFADFWYCLLSAKIRIFRLLSCIDILNTISCKIIYFGISTSEVSALGFILLIFLERYIGIVYPFRKGLSGKSIVLLTLLNFTFSLIFWIPILIYTWEKNGQCKTRQSARDTFKIYVWLWMIFHFLLPVSTMCFFYYRIRKVLKETSSLVSDEAFSLLQRKRLTDNKRIMTILFGILLAFVVFVFSQRLIWIIYINHGISNFKGIQWLFFFAEICYEFHAIVNPIIYSVIDSKFRARVKQICRKKPSKNESSLT